MLDLKARGAHKTHRYDVDLNRMEEIPSMLDASFSELGKVEIVLIAHGTLPDQKSCDQSVNQALEEFSGIGLNVIALLTLLLNSMESQRSGIIAVISSVTGERG